MILFATMIDLRFSLATSAEFNQISEINSENLDSIDTGGFLVIPLDEEDILYAVCEDSIDFFVAKDENHLIQGYVEVTTHLDESLIDNMQYVSSEHESKLKEILSGRYIYIKQLAVRRTCQKKGIGSFIYRKLEETLGLPILAFVANKPQQNKASLHFHLKHNFIEFATLHRVNFGRFLKYESRLFVKSD